jgi:uncharacterized protein (DUF362 family)
MTTKVAVIQAEEGIHNAVERSLSLLGSPAKTGHRLLLKPNLFTTITAEKGATTTLRRITYITHPTIHQPWSR